MSLWVQAAKKHLFYVAEKCDKDLGKIKVHFFLMVVPFLILFVLICPYNMRLNYLFYVEIIHRIYLFDFTIIITF